MFFRIFEKSLQFVPFFLALWRVLTAQDPCDDPWYACNGPEWILGGPFDDGYGYAQLFCYKILKCDDPVFLWLGYLIEAKIQEFCFFRFKGFRGMGLLQKFNSHLQVILYEYALFENQQRNTSKNRFKKGQNKYVGISKHHLQVPTIFFKGIILFTFYLIFILILFRIFQL